MYIEFVNPITTTCSSKNSTPYGRSVEELELGGVYKVKTIQVLGTVTYLQLEIDNCWYNSVHFSLMIDKYLELYQTLQSLQSDGITIKRIKPDN